MEMLPARSPEPSYLDRLDVGYSCPDSLMSRKLHLVDSLLPGGHRLLDVGSGQGALLARAQTKYRELFGTDVNAEAVKLCRERLRDGLKTTMLEGDIDELIPALRAKAPFDAVTLLDVLEHVGSPMRTLCAVKTLLAPGGTLVATMPNWYDFFWSPLIGNNEHRHFHSSLGWARTITRAGYSVALVRTVKFPVVDLDVLSRRWHLFGMCVCIRANS